MPRKNTSRLSFDVSPDLMEKLRGLQQRCDLPTLTDLMRKSLALFDLSTDHIRSGGSIILKNKNGTHEVLKLL